MHKEPHISIYPKSIIELQMILEKENIKKPFLVTGKKSFKSCGAENSLQWLFGDFEVLHFNEFEVNPNSKDVEKGVELYKNSNCDAIISVGGGSAMDMAKLINYYHNVSNLEITKETLINRNPDFTIHIAVPTTAGSGSESTHFAVLYIDGEKYSIAHQDLLPNYVLIDPELHYSQSDYQKAVSGIDALAQAIESIWNVHATKLSALYAENALNLLWNYLPKAVLEEDKGAILNVAIGANLAGRAINITKTTAPHALSYGFTQYEGLPHGHAVALSLPYFLNLHDQVTDENCNTQKGKEFVIRAMDKINHVIGYRENPNALKSFFDQIGVETDMQKLNIEAEVCKQVIDNINLERLANNPVKFDKKDLYNYWTKK